MICHEKLHQLPSALKVVAPVLTGHDNSKHPLIAYSVVPLHWRHAPRSKGNQVSVAYIGKFLTLCAVHSACRTAAGFVLLLQNNASYGKA
jgi:hypothetical protein